MYILHSEIVYTCITTITDIIENIFIPLNGLVFSSAESKIESLAPALGNRIHLLSIVIGKFCLS